ncbi:MAG: riboflavin kinase, partial [Actinomycetota bacterium]|nr:riboflavin kinase [Actinomycetota bacterium]
ADLYGQRVAVDFVGRIRGQEKFDTVADLVAVMNTDVEKTRDLLAGG